MVPPVCVFKSVQSVFMLNHSFRLQPTARVPCILERGSNGLLSPLSEAGMGVTPFLVDKQLRSFPIIL